jgi:hypothetical protein
MRRWQSGQLHLTVNQAPYGLRRFKSFPTHQRKTAEWRFFVRLILRLTGHIGGHEFFAQETALSAFHIEGKLIILADTDRNRAAFHNSF